jgi:hypothetical protein
LVAKKACSVERIEDGKGLLVRIVSILTKLVDRFSSSDQIREERAQYVIEDEEEDEEEEEEDEEDEEERRFGREVDD